jgi:hypothetical protein
MIRYPTAAPIDDFVLLFLPPCGPYLTPLATGSLKSGLLVSPLLGGPARHRPFAPTLHLHQHNSRCNLHLQYSAKSQSTPRCQSFITARSDHSPVLGRSGPHLYHMQSSCNLHRQLDLGFYSLKARTSINSPCSLCSAYTCATFEFLALDSAPPNN